MPYWYQRVLRLAGPLILSNLTQPLLSTVDTILSGHLPGPAALGGVALGGTFFNTIFWTFGFLRMATTGLVAQSHGAGRHDELLHHFGRALVSAMLIGVAILFIQSPLISVSLGLLGGGPGVQANAHIYCAIRIWSAPAALANYTILGFLLGRQRARTALVLQALINVVNVVIALFLVMKLSWGVAGIATATLVAEWFGCLVGLGVLASGGVHLFRLRVSELIRPQALLYSLSLNRDIFLRTLSLVAVYGWFARTGARAGDVVLAANAVLMNFQMIAAFGLDGFANATEALIGESIGARRRSDYRAVLKAAALCAFLVAALLSLVYLIFGTWLVTMFSSDRSIQVFADQYLYWIVLLPLVSVWSFLLDGVYIGATQASELRNSMVVSLLGFLVLSLLLGHYFGNNGLWAAMLGFMAVRAITLAIRLPHLESAAFDLRNGAVDV